jgi:hypothetical protein
VSTFGIIFLLVLAFAVLVVVAGSYFTVPCGNCGSKAGRRFRYQRVDGGPDRRYHNNAVICRSCGKPWIVPKPVAVIQTNSAPYDQTSRQSAQSSIPDALPDHPDHPSRTQTTKSCHYVLQRGVRRFEDCPDYPKLPGEKCSKCWISRPSET